MGRKDSLTITARFGGGSMSKLLFAIYKYTYYYND